MRLLGRPPVEYMRLLGKRKTSTPNQTARWGARNGEDRRGAGGTDWQTEKTDIELAWRYYDL